MKKIQYKGMKIMANVKKQGKKSHIILKKIIGGLLLTMSLLMMAYPFISEWIFEHRQDSLIQTYKSDVKDASDEKIAEELQKAQAYNESLFHNPVNVPDPFGAGDDRDANSEYNSLLNLQGNGCMGYIEIPKIDVNLPIYHGTSASVLENGIGHLEGSSLPVGGNNSHCVLTGHTGLNRAKLFTDLVQLKEGDLFFLYVLRENLAYEVDQILVVEPQEVDSLTIEAGKDYCTLITCTPYGVNSHRLLVRGHRTTYTEEAHEQAASEKKDGESQWKRQYKKALGYAIVLIIVLIGISEIGGLLRRKKRRQHKDTEE